MSLFKKLILNARFVRIIFFISILLISFSLFSSNSVDDSKQQDVIPPDPIDASVDYSEYWQNILEQRGGEYARKKFSEVYEVSPSSHFGMHIFASLLYKIEGIDAFKVCDPSFAYACYHGFIAEAIKDRGLGVIKELDDKCYSSEKIWGSACQHGIGHGLIEYYNNEMEGVEPSLAECDKLREPESLIGCSNGVLMGYNFQMNDYATTDRLISARPLIGSPHAFCNALSSKYRKLCYFTMPQWWFFVYSNDYSKLGELCSNITSKEQKESCFRGVGTTIVLSNNNHKSATKEEKCNLMPDSWSKDLCLKGIRDTSPQFSNEINKEIKF